MKIIVITLLLFTNSIFSYEFELTSNNKQTQVVELFTSEGCSSCPPADRWLATLKHKAELWKDFVPVAFHVDYWDYIGWHDKFALAQNTQRHYLHKSNGNINSVYTPAILKAGKEWRYWKFKDIEKSDLDTGKLSLKINQNNLTAQFKDLNNKGLNLVISLLAMNVVTKVKAGENTGKVLKHNFVVLKQKHIYSNSGSWDYELDAQFFKSEQHNLAFVAWVEMPNNPAPIQAVGRFL